LGLLEENFLCAPFQVFKGKIKSKKKYDIVIYAVEVKDKENFVTPHYETEKTVWLTNKEFQQYGRDSHREIVDYIHEQIPNI